MRRLLLLVLFALSTAGTALAVEPGERLSDPALEARARALGAELRCLVCQNTSIDESNADLAHDLRVLLRQRLKAGDSDRQVLDFMVSRYGEFVLLKPRFQPATWILWLGTPALLAAGGVYLGASAMRRRAAAPAALTEAELSRARRLLEAEPGQPGSAA